MTLTGQHLIDGAWTGSNAGRIDSELPGVSIAQVTDAEIDAAARAARRDFRALAATSGARRAALLDGIADEIDARGNAITRVGMTETGLPMARLVGERGRTTGQLRLFAEMIRDTAYLGNRHDEAMPDRAPLPRPDLKLTKRPIGPVVVFGASNFPLAFSTAGGDTASALAAGCSVIVKGHPAHPGTTELVAQAIAAAITRIGVPSGTFQMVHDAAPDAGAGLVTHPEIAAVRFTGSLGAGRALFDLCAARPVPIPFFGELGSINPVFCLPAALAARADAIGEGWVTSLTIGGRSVLHQPRRNPWRGRSRFRPHGIGRCPGAGAGPSPDHADPAHLRGLWRGRRGPSRPTVGLGRDRTGGPRSHRARDCLAHRWCDFPRNARIAA